MVNRKISRQFEIYDRRNRRGFLFPSWWEVKVSVAVTLFVITAYWLFTYGDGGGGGDSNRSSSADDDIDGSKYKLTVTEQTVTAAARGTAKRTPVYTLGA
ncbi:hypothetical protein LguiB_020926 [Lonicera macranthoides]